MISFSEMVSPSFLLFPALLGSLILGLVCPLVGVHLVLRRTVLLGLTLPQIAAAGIAFTFWLQHLGVFPKLGAGERSVGMVGSLLFTLLGMGLLGYMDRRGRGLAEGRLAAAYALAGALTILFIVFNPTGEVEILGLLKGEVIALSRAEIKILAAVFSLVFLGMLYFRREFLLSSFDRDLAFLLKGGNVLWDVLLYLLAGVSIAIGVIMAGPLLIFGFLVLPPLAARPIVRGMNTFLALSSFLGVLMAFFGFYLSVTLDLPLGPTDVALGCSLVFVGYAIGKVLTRRAAAICALFFALPFLTSACGTKASLPLGDVQQLKDSTVWVARVKNSTDSSLRLPGTNPLRSLAEMAGKISPEDRQTVMALMRESLAEEFDRRGIKVSSPEASDKRLVAFPSGVAEAARVAREGKLTGLLFLTEIRRWGAERQFVRVLVDFRLVRIEDGTLVWQREIQRAVATLSASHLGQAYTDAIREVMRELFES